MKIIKLEEILQIESHRGINIECGFNEPIQMCNKNNRMNINKEYDNQMIF